ncbi:hypothetical protein I4U23_018020 [Adineta vaga]|nr:hypothetical protein I4U23_018020 [Adineta vaga]
MFSNLSQKIYVLLFLFLCSIQLNQSLRCYECLDCEDITCNCTNIIETDSKTSFCTLVRENTPSGFNVEIRHLPRNLSTHYESNPYYISVKEEIRYNASIDQWLSSANTIAFACQTDECNRPDLLKELPVNGLSLMLPSNWLNENLRRKSHGQTSSCYNCPEDEICTQTIYKPDLNKCELEQCKGICILSQTMGKSQSNQYCYESYCVYPENPKPEILIYGIYYIDNQIFDLIESDVSCAGPNCSRLEIFQDIKDKLQKNYNNIKPFLPSNNVKSLSISSIVIFMMIIFQIIFY